MGAAGTGINGGLTQRMGPPPVEGAPISGANIVVGRHRRHRVHRELTRPVLLPRGTSLSLSRLERDNDVPFGSCFFRAAGGRG